MEGPPKLPLDLQELPEGIRRFCDPKGPGAVRMMAARGGVPVRGVELVTMLAQLSADPDRKIKEVAEMTLSALPEEVLLPACQGALHPSVLDLLASTRKEQEEVLLAVVANPRTADATVVNTARHCSEQVCERIAVNEARLLKAPTIIEAMYMNRNTRMSTADRLVELAGRNNIELAGIPAFGAHLQAVQNQLIAEPTPEPLPSDLAFNETIDGCDSDNVAFEIDDDGSETLMDEGKPLSMRIKNMTQAEKIRLAAIGSSGARALLVRDQDKAVAYAAISAPSTTAEDAAAIAPSREIGDHILRYIGNKREWLRNYELKRALVFNPKTPVGISLKFMSHMRTTELKRLSHSKEIPAQLRSVAAQWLERRRKN